MKYDYLVVGAGFAGAVMAERLASQLDKKVLVIDRRNHLAGNCYDFRDESGIYVHKYGPHAFHTNSKKVWDYLSKFTTWTSYEHRVLAVIDGKKVPIPFNFNSIEMLFPQKDAQNYINTLKSRYGENIKVPILKLMQENSKELKFLAEYVYNKVFLGYTLKQWGLKPEELHYSVTSRVPIFIGRDNRYFYDTYQAIPTLGYTKLFENIFKNKNIFVELNTEFRDIESSIKFDKIIYTGPIDYFFDYKYGKLPYRSLHFVFEKLDNEYFQEVAQVNYPNDYDWTRITEFKHFHNSKTLSGRLTRSYKHLMSQKNKSTIIAYEYPQYYEIGVNEPYYPIPKSENEELYNKYFNEAKKLENTVLFIGRLAEYKYYNMDEIIGAVLLKFEKMFRKNGF